MSTTVNRPPPPKHSPRGPPVSPQANTGNENLEIASDESVKSDTTNVKFSNYDVPTTPGAVLVLPSSGSQNSSPTNHPPPPSRRATGPKLLSSTSGKTTGGIESSTQLDEVSSPPPLVNDSTATDSSPRIEDIYAPSSTDNDYKEMSPTLEAAQDEQTDQPDESETTVMMTNNAGDSIPVEPEYMKQLTFNPAVNVGTESRHNKYSPTGLTRSTSARTEIPAEVLERTLLVGETVVGEFDYYYNNPEKFPRQFSNTLVWTLCTAGVYLIWLYLIKPLINIVVSWFSFGMGYCRGKMLITSEGRVICWSLQVHQSLFGCDQRAYFTVDQMTHIFHVKDIRQTSVVYSDFTGLGLGYCMWACCRRYITGVDVVFKQFDHSPKHRLSSFISTSTHQSYLNTLKRFMSTMGTIFHGTAIAQDNLHTPIVFRLTSTPHDRCYDGEFGIEALEDICTLNQKLAAIMGHFCSENVFMSAAETQDDLQLQHAGATTRLVGIKDTCNDLEDFDCVDQDGRVTVPLRWVPLGPDEQLVTAVGQRGYHMTCVDWLRSVLSAGVYYWRVVRPKRVACSAIIVTTRRVIEVYVYERVRGRVPAGLNNFQAVVRSFYPGEVHSGYMYGDGSRFWSVIDTKGGSISCNLSLDHLAFARALQLTVSRQSLAGDPHTRMPLQLRDAVHQPAHGRPDSRRFSRQSLGSSNRKLQSINNNAATAAAVSGGAGSPRSSASYSLVASDSNTSSGANNIEDNDILFPEDLLYLPLMNSEVPLYRFEGGAQSISCGWVADSARSWWKCNWGPGDSLLPLFMSLTEWLVRMATFGRWSVQAVPAMIVTNKSLFYLSAYGLPTSHAKCCDCSRKLFPAHNKFFLIWVPVCSVVDEKTALNMAGGHPVGRICTSCPVSCVPPIVHIRSQFAVTIGTTLGITLGLFQSKRNMNWTRDQRLLAFQAILGSIVVMTRAQAPFTSVCNNNSNTGSNNNNSSYHEGGRWSLGRSTSELPGSADDKV